MLTTAYSPNKLITRTKNYMLKYDVVDHFIIVEPIAAPNSHTLILDQSKHGTGSKTTNLWAHALTTSSMVIIIWIFIPLCNGPIVIFRKLLNQSYLLVLIQHSYVITL